MLLTDAQIVNIAFEATEKTGGPVNLKANDFLAIYHFLAEVRRMEAEIEGPPFSVTSIFDAR